MKLKRAIDLQSQFILRLKDEYSATQCFQRTADQHIEALKRSIFATKEWKRVPGHVRSFVKGAESILWDNLYAGKDAPLVYIIIGQDGKRFGPGNDEWLKETSEYKSAMTGKHAWRKAWENGEFKEW